MQLFDSHCHFNDEKYDNDRDKIIQEAFESGVTKMTCAGYNIESSIQAIELSKQYDYIYATSGISPNDMDDADKLEELEKLLSTEKVVAVGEIGLDYYWNKDNKEEQKQLFIKQIELANKYNLPIQIHTREASIDTISILKEYTVYKKGISLLC